MKVNNIFTTTKGVWAIIAVCAVVNVITLLINGGAQIWDDSPSYVNAWEDVSHFDINIYRTPVYPLLIGICKMVFGEELMLDAVVVAQIIIFLVSVWFLYKSSMLVTSSRYISFCATFAYAFFPDCRVYNTVIMTESLSISGMVFLMYLTLKALKSQSLKYPVLMCLVMLILLLLRPSFLFLIPIYIVGWGVLFFTRKSQRKLYGAGLIGISLVTLSLVGYACAFKAKYGVFGTSNVSIINNYYVCRQYGILEASVTDNPKLKEAVEKFYVKYGRTNYAEALWRETNLLFHSGDYELTDLNVLVGNSIAMHKATFAKSIVMRLLESRTVYWGPVKLYAYLGFVVIALFYIVYVAIKRRTLPIISTYLLSCIVVLYVVSIIGAQDSWGRLTYPVFPCWLLLAAHFISLFQRNLQRELM